MVERQSHVSLGEPRSLLLPPLAQIGSRDSGPHRRVATLLLVAAALLTLIAACGGAGSRLPPAAPGAVMATPIAGGIRVTWDDLSDNESEFVVYRSDADAAEDEEGHELTEVARVPNDTVSYQDFGVTMDGSYLYAVASANQFGLSDQVLQEPADPVSPAVGVRLTITLAGVGHVAIDDGFSIVTCSSECVLGVASGAAVALTAVGSDETAFAGWSGACGGAGTCRLTPTGDVDVEARFTTHVLLLVATGDSPVAVEVSPPDSFNATECVLGRGESCAFGYDFGAALKVSVNSEVVEAGDGAVFVGYDGACTSPQGRFCLIDVDGKTEVEIEVIRSPVVADIGFTGREDTELVVDEDDGVLRDVVDSPGDTHTAVLVTPPASGDLDMAPDGSFSYQPAADANGPVVFEFRAVDAHGNTSATRTATLDIKAVNDPPRFQLDGDPPATFGHGNVVTRTNFATGVHPGGGPDEAAQTLTFSLVQASGQPGLFSEAPTLVREGTSATLTYTPAAGRFGTARFDVVLQDDEGVANGGDDTSDSQSFTITVSPVVLTTSVSSGQGDIQRSPPTAGGAGDFDYGWGTSVALMANPDAGYMFGSWGGACQGQANPCNLTLNGNRSVSAAFSAIIQVTTPTIVGPYYSVSSDSGGINNCNSLYNVGTCTSTFSIGTDVVLTSTNARTFTGVSCQETNMPSVTCTFTVNGPLSITVQ